MDPESKKFGKGPRELTGAVDLISYYKLLPHHDFFCKKSLPLSISDTHYLHNVAGDSEIRKGEGMQLDQLIQNTAFPRDTNTRIQPFDLDTLREAFQLRETAPVDLPSRREFLLLRENLKVNRRIRKRSTKNTRTKTGKKIESIKNTNIVIKIEVKIKIRKRRRMKAVIMILVLNLQRNTTIRKESMMEMKNSVTFTGTRKVSTRAQRWMKWVQ